MTTTLARMFGGLNIDDASDKENQGTSPILNNVSVE
jgi:hypothetical protein